jgi:aspartate aminotransferase
VRLAARLREVSVSQTIALTIEADRLRAAGRSIVDLGLGEPDFDTPDHIKQAGVEAIRENFSHYTVTAGMPELRRAIASRYRERDGADYVPDEVLVGCGAKNVLFALAMALWGQGDEVAVFAPWWVSYPDQIRLAGARPLFVPTREDDAFTPRVEALADRLSPSTRAVILNSACNPSGATVPRAELRAFARLAVEKDLVIVSDEVYEAFTYDGEHGASFASLLAGEPGLRERLVIVSAFSKSYAMTGWRAGYAVGPGEIIRGALKVLSHDSSQAPSITQKAALAALTGPPEPLAAMRAEYERRRNYLLGVLQGTPGFRVGRPSGAFYLFPNVTGLFERLGVGSSGEVAARLLQRSGLATIPGEAFGMPGYLRLSYAASMPVLEEAARRLREAVAS